MGDDRLKYLLSLRPVGHGPEDASLRLLQHWQNLIARHSGDTRHLEALLSSSFGIITLPPLRRAGIRL
jgi:hypothetical protein